MFHRVRGIFAKINRAKQTIIDLKYKKDTFFEEKDTGSMMLRGLNPKKVAEKCQIYFAGACRDIAKLGD